MKLCFPPLLQEWVRSILPIFQKILISSLKGAIDTWSSIDEPAKELFRTTFVGIFTVIEECTKLVIMQDKEARRKSRVRQ